MRVFNLRGLDSKANIAINEALNFASRSNFDCVNSGHLLYIMLKNKEVAHKFEMDTGISPDLFKTEMDNLAKSMIKADEVIKEELGIDDISTELHIIISNTIKVAKENNRIVTIVDLYKAVLRDSGSFAWNVLTILGVDAEKVINSIDDPLENMEVTSKFGVNYNTLAKTGRFDPIDGRDDIIDSIIEVMGRRIKNNPCLVGDAGVGKTAIIEGLAQRLVSGNVPHYMEGKQIISVDISGVVAGSKYRGDFEERFNNILYEAAANKNVILFFDEIHMLAEAGGGSADSSMTAANILKPAISRGDVQIIGATTLSEYKKFIEKDKAFERRMETVTVGEPSVEKAIKMVHAVIEKYNEFHSSVVTDEAIDAAVILSDRYITDKKLPDKAITVIDETAARLKKSGKRNKEILIRASDIKETVSKLTGIDIQDLDDKAKDKLKSLSDNLNKHVIGQDDAINSLSKAIRRSRTGIKDPNKPIGTFLFVGPTGVGKTELTKALAIEFGGGIKNLIRFDMSEFMEKHSVSKLIGSPPGYVGYGDGGQLTEAVKRNPYSIILFDEIEKAHSDVFNIMLQILDDGILTDSEGTHVDFKNTVIIMTSNAGYGAGMLNKKSIGFGTNAEKSNDDKEKIALKALEETFRPEFLNRLDKVVIFDALTKNSCYSIAELLLNQLKKRMRDNNYGLNWDKSLIEHLIDIGFSEKYGARNIKRAIQENVEDLISDKIIDGELNQGDTIKVSYKDKINTKIKHSLSKELELADNIVVEELAQV